MNLVGDKEFAINYAEGGIASLTASILKYKNKALKLAQKYPNEVKCYVNNDGSVYLTFPPDWIKFPAPKKSVSAETRTKAAERLKKARAAKDNENI